MNRDGKLIPSGKMRKEHAQRTHIVEHRIDGIYVLLNVEGDYDSDRYSNLRSCMPRDAKNRNTGAHAAANRGHNLHSTMPSRSGYVLNRLIRGSSQNQNAKK